MGFRRVSRCVTEMSGFFGGYEVSPPAGDRPEPAFFHALWSEFVVWVGWRVSVELVIDWVKVLGWLGALLWCFAVWGVVIRLIVGWQA